MSGCDDLWVCFFFFKQKTAYEMLRSLVGSEMCIRDSEYTVHEDVAVTGESFVIAWPDDDDMLQAFHNDACLLYTSDAADDLLCVDLGGRRIIKKKKTSFIDSQFCS